MPETRSFNVGSRSHGFLDPYVVAEIGVNHEGNLDRAKNMIVAIADAGGHAAKFQTYKAEKLATVGSSPAYWDTASEATPSQFELFRKYDAFGPDEYRELAEHCRLSGIDFLSTPFDLEAVDLLAPLVPAMKIASADITNIPLLRSVGKTALPVILSVGASRHHEIAVALDELRRAGAKEIALLHCVLNYPTPPAQAQLAQLDSLRRAFGTSCAIGYSDHVPPDPSGSMPALEVALLRGSVVIEKHFTDDKTAKGNDHYHAMDAADLSSFMKRISTYAELFGNDALDLSGQEAAIRNARRRIVSSRDIREGALIGEEDLTPLRSNTGIEVAHWDEIIGRITRRSISAGEPLHWSDME